MKLIKSSAEKVLFGFLYSFIALFSLIGSNIPTTGYIGIIIFFGSLVVWYFILKFIFWIGHQVIGLSCYVFLRLSRYVFPFLLKIPKALWNFILNRVRELGKAIRNE